jgi:micrococcal nuclease
MKTLIFSILTALMLSGVDLAEEVKGKVVSVIDGNTFQVRDQNKKMHKIVLKGIDCPELEQEYGPEAKKFLEKLILHKEVTIYDRGKDKLGNPLVDVKIKGVKDPRVDLLKEGLAWPAEKNTRSDLEYLRESAQLRGKGLWKQNNPTPPWVYRREQSLSTRKNS